MLRLLVLATLWPLASWGATYDFDYRSVGDPDARPTNVFDDGAATYFQFATGRPVPVILKVGPAGEQLAAWRVNGPYVVVDGVLPDWRLRLGRGIAAVRYAGTRLLAMKGALYGAAEPISEGGPVAAPVAPTPSQAQRPASAPTLSAPQTTPPGADVEIAKPAQIPPAPAPIPPSVPAQTVPDFSGSFVVQMGASVAIPQPPRRAPAPAPEVNTAAPMLKLALALPVSRHVSERLTVRFSDLSASASDQVALDAAARQANGMGAGYIVVRAYSGAWNLKSRQRYASLRGEEVKLALVRAGVNEKRVRVVIATKRTASRADIMFIGRGTPV